MPLMMIQATLKPESGSVIVAAIQRLYSALEDTQPPGVRYASLRLPDHITAVTLLGTEARPTTRPTRTSPPTIAGRSAK